MPGDVMIKTMIKLANFLDQIGLNQDADVVDHLIKKESKKNKKKKWIQGVVTKEERDKFGEWCKRNGFEEGVCQSCIDKAIAKGGKTAKMANFAINVSKGKYKHPGKKKSKK